MTFIVTTKMNLIIGTDPRIGIISCKILDGLVLTLLKWQLFDQMCQPTENAH